MALPQFVVIAHAYSVGSGRFTPLAVGMFHAGGPDSVLMARFATPILAPVRLGTTPPAPALYVLGMLVSAFALRSVLPL